MTELRGFRAHMIVLVLAVALPACTASPEVRELSEKTAANIGTLSLAIDDMSQQSRRLAARRAANAARLSAATARVESRVELDHALLQQSGDGAALKTFNALKDWSNKVRQIDAKAALDEAELIRQILAQRSDIDSKSKALSGVAGILATLAKEESVKDRAGFLIEFGKDVYDDVQKKRKDAEEAVKEGEKKLAASESSGQ